MHAMARTPVRNTKGGERPRRKKPHVGAQGEGKETREGSYLGSATRTTGNTALGTRRALREPLTNKGGGAHA